jgi:hypothetical protein
MEGDTEVSESPNAGEPYQMVLNMPRKLSPIIFHFAGVAIVVIEK